MTSKPETIFNKVSTLPENYRKPLIEFKDWLLDEQDNTERNASNYLKIMTLFSEHLKGKDFSKVTREDIVSFLDKRKKSIDQDPEKKWIGTWNNYLGRLVGFYRWFENREKGIDRENWDTPEIIRTIKQKKNKRKAIYSPNDVWTEEELLLAVKYSNDIRTKLILTLSWDLAARNHEITKLRIRDIVMKEKYAEISTSWDTKTGTRTNPSILSFPYLKEYLNKHPFATEPNSYLILNKLSMKPLTPDTVWSVTNELKKSIKKIIKDGQINKNESDLLRILLKKPWNPYLIGRHSSITEKTDTLTDSQLKQFSGWTPNSDRIITYVHRKSKQVINPLLEEYGIVEKKERMPTRKECPKCGNVNTNESIICSDCSYVLNNKGWEYIKLEEEQKDKDLKLQLAALESKLKEQQLRLDENEKFREEVRQAFKNKMNGLPLQEKD